MLPRPRLISRLFNDRREEPQPPNLHLHRDPPHPDIHGVYASPVYTPAGDTLPTLGARPVQRAPVAVPPAGGAVAAGGAAAAAATSTDEFANVDFGKMVEGIWNVPTDDPSKPVHFTTFMQPTATGTLFFFEGAKFANAVFSCADMTGAANKLSEVSRYDKRLLKVCYKSFI